MQEVFEKIIENLEKEKLRCFDTGNQLSTDKIGIWCFDRAKEIVTQAAAEYNNGWIPVEEMLPEDGEEVLATNGKHVYLVEYDEDLDACFGDMDGIIAWQPRPELYQPNICIDTGCPYNEGKKCPAAEGRVRRMAEHDGCKGCRYELQDEHLEPCFHCDGTKQGDKYTRMTNADRIRSMSDEELAEFLCNIHEPDLETIVIDNKDFFAEVEIEEWLQSEAEVKE